MLKDFSRGVLNFVLPPVCVCCDNVLERNQDFVCSSCLAKLKKVDIGYNIWGDRVHKVSFEGNALQPVLVC